MNKAFTKESDDGDDPLDAPEPWPLPEGVKNYMTPSGERAIKDELAERRATLLATRDRAEKRAIERRIRALERRLAEGEVVDPRAQPRDRVLFGARAVVLDEDGAERTYWIVGVDQADSAKGWISWQSALAKALLGARPGQIVTVRAPGGTRELEVARIEAPPADDG